MNRIEVKVLNPHAIADAEKMMVCAARLTQRGEKIKDLQDLEALLDKPYSPATAEGMCRLPHTTIQRFGTIMVAVVGASRRFLAQITRHQDDVHFMSASLQYSDYTGEADFVAPYNVLTGDALRSEEYFSSCRSAMQDYADLRDQGLDNDSCGYVAPQGLRNVLLIGATPWEWKHMISQRICRRNTDETRYVMLLIWKALKRANQDSPLFNDCGCFCMLGPCREGKMGCQRPLKTWYGPGDIIAEDFPGLPGGRSGT